MIPTKTKRELKLEEIAKRYADGAKSDGSVFVATGHVAPSNHYGGAKPIADPSWGFRAGASGFSAGHTAFTDTVFKQNDPMWAQTKYGSHEEHRQASVAVQSENASGGHALFRVDAGGVGHLGKHDPMLSEADLSKRITHQTILGIPSGQKTNKSSKFNTYDAFNQSERSARAQAATTATAADVSDFKGHASLRLETSQAHDIGTVVTKSGSSQVRKMQVTLNSAQSQAQVKAAIGAHAGAGAGGGVPWNVAQHFPKP